MMRTFLRLALFASSLLTTLPVLAQSPAARGLPESVRSVATDRSNILVLTSYQFGLPVPDSIHRGILAASRERTVSSEGIFVEHLDLARTSDSEHRINLVALLRHKLAGKRFGVVILDGSPAVDFVTGEGKDLFPDAVLITLITPSTDALIDDPRKVIDIPWRVDPAGTLRAALDLFPKTRRVVVVTGARDGVLPFLDQARKALAPWQSKLEIEFTNEMTYEEMMRTVATLPADSLVIYSPYFSDTSGRSFVPAEVVIEVNRTATAPVFGTMEAYLGSGIVGGSLLKTETLGKTAGELALSYLDGRLELVKQRTSFDPTTQMMFDWKELVRWKADIARLPEGSIVINRPSSLWGQYKAEVTAVAVSFLILSGLLVTLLLLNRRLRQSKAAASEAEGRFRGLVEQSIAGIYMIQDGRFIYANPRQAAILGFASAEELSSRDVLSVVAEKDRSRVADSIRMQLEGIVESRSYEWTAVRKDGTLVEVGVHGARATNDGRPAIIGLMEDISEKRQIEEVAERHFAEIQAAFMSTVKVATTLSELRDPYTAGHERRVGEIAVAIGAELGFEEARLDGLRVAGYLHDIGKITIPAEILAKPGKLSSIEYQLIEAHSRASYDVLKDVKFPWPVAEVALQHHERIDGSGYPQGLRGEEILLEARILAVADVVEAMSSARPYRPGLGIDAAIAEIERGRASLYEPTVADACLRLFREKGYQLPE